MILYKHWEFHLISFLTMGQASIDPTDELFNLTYFALRTCATVNGVSRLHSQVS